MAMIGSLKENSLFSIVLRGDGEGIKEFVWKNPCPFLQLESLFTNNGSYVSGYYKLSASRARFVLEFSSQSCISLKLNIVSP